MKRTVQGILSLTLLCWVVIAQDPSGSCSASDESCTNPHADQQVQQQQQQQQQQEEIRKPAQVLETIPIDFGEPQVILDHDTEITRNHLQQTYHYIMAHPLWKQSCKNNHYLCSFWAATNECNKNPTYMNEHCAPSCRKCAVPEAGPRRIAKNNNNNVNNANTTTTTTSQTGDATSSSTSVTTEQQQEQEEPGILVSTSYGEAQFVPTTGADPVVQVIAKTTTYLRQKVFVEPMYATVRDECKNRHSHCSLWATEGECTNNPGFMQLQCAPSCQTCEMISYEYRCPYDKDAPTALNPGDLDQMFERILKDFPHHTPSILSSPNTTDGPWVIQLDTFATSDECERLIEQGHQKGYGQSMTVGKRQFDGSAEAVVAAVRTSTNAWCEGPCMEDPVVIELHDRMEQVLGIPVSHWEFLQLLRYEPSQFYKKHHDYLEKDLDRPQGVRILTLFLYLNDVEEGGETRFSNLDINVEPKQGRAILWTSVFNDAPNVKDHRTEHEALEVKKGIKFGANAWVHQRDYRTPHYNNCA